MKRFFLLITFAFFTFTASAQEADVATVKIDGSVYIIRVAKDKQIRNFISGNVYPPYKVGFSVEVTEMNCNLSFRASAIKRRDGAAVVTLWIGTLAGKKSSSFDKQIVIKKGEKKDLELKSKLKCMDDKQYSVSVSY